VEVLSVPESPKSRHVGHLSETASSLQWLILYIKKRALLESIVGINNEEKFFKYLLSIVIFPLVHGSQLSSKDHSNIVFPFWTSWRLNPLPTKYLWNFSLSFITYKEPIAHAKEKATLLLTIVLFLSPNIINRNEMPIHGGKLHNNSFSTFSLINLSIFFLEDASDINHTAT